MRAQDIKDIVKSANGRPIKFVSANATFIHSRDKFTTVFLDYTNERLIVLRPEGDPYSNTTFPFERTYIEFDEVETATILMTMEETEQFIRDNEANMIYKDEKDAEAVIKELRNSPAIVNFDPTPASSPYGVKRTPLRSQIIKPQVKP